MGQYDFIFGLILIITLVLIITDKFDKTKVSVTGAGIALFFAILPNSGVVNTNSNPNGVLVQIGDLLNFIQPDLLLIIIGMTMMIGVTAQTGIFEYIALKLLKRSGGKPLNLLFFLSAFTLVASAFLDAYMAIILIGSITLISTEGLEHENGDPINPKPYILAEAIFGNTGGMLTRVASPPNLILGRYFEISFIDFAVFMFPVVLVSAASTFIILTKVFKEELSKKISTDSVGKLMTIEEEIVVRDWKDFYKAAIIIVLTIVGFFIQSPLYNNFHIYVELGYIALAGGFASVVLLSHGHNAMEESLRKVEWSIVFFFAGLLLIVNLVEQVNLLGVVAAPFDTITKISKELGLISIIITNTLLSSVLDNVPMAAIMAGIIKDINTSTGANVYPFVWASVIGTNLGGNITPIGSASTVQAVQMLNKDRPQERNVSFREFLKIGAIVTIIPVIFGSLYVTFLSLFFYH